MNKVAAEIIAGLIPHKVARNRWRGILRFGLFNALKLRRAVKKTSNSPSVGLAVCAIAKNEGDYFGEWIDWHLKMGVEKFFIYDNGSTDDTYNILKPYIEKGIVDYIYFPGYRMQLAAYDDCLSRHRFDVEWIAFIDIDEFIVPVRDLSIPQFLSSFDEAAAVEINWLVYGSSGLQKKSPQPVMSRFRRHSLFNHPLNQHVKSIVRPRKIYNMIGCHQASRLSGRIFDSHGKIVKKHYKDRAPLQDIIRINHYAVKSRQEFIEKQGRGRASGTKRNVPDEYFVKYDLNDIRDN